MSAAAARAAVEASDLAVLNGRDGVAERSMQRAQVLATIALAEAQEHLVKEQRTANLIAAFERDAIQPPHETASANQPFWNALAVDITERLDLA